MTLWSNGRPNIYPKSWTKAQIHRASQGLHPANGMPLAEQPDGDEWNQCRNCAHAKAFKANRTYWKCTLNNNTHGPGTDIRLNWPACTLWQPK